MKVLFRFDAGAWLQPKLDAIAGPDLSVVLCSEHDEETYRAQMRDCDVLWHVLRPVTREAIEAAGKLKLIQKIGVGVNTIDLEAARERGVAVCNMPGTNSRAVAEMTLLLMLACLRRLCALDPLVRRGEGWSWPQEWQEGLGEIHGRTVGLVGFGAVPRLLAPILSAMGATVIYTGRRRYDDVPFSHVGKDELLARSDIVSLHVPLAPETTNWLDATAMAQMKAGAVVINVARGGLVDEQALLAALERRQIAAAGLDVFAQEPAAAGHALFSRSDVVLSPHVGWLTRETFERSMAVAVENCRRLMTGGGLLNRVI
jgi:phosphoglycerate dehydrogenase-like enzyme